MFDIIPNTLSLLLTTLLPLYATHKSLSSASPSLLAPWATYYALASLIPAFELLLPLITYLPFYAWARLGVHLYLLLPGQGQGATYIYARYVRPWLVVHETAIEDGVKNVHERAEALGWGYIKQALQFARENLLGLPKSAPATPLVAPQAANSYVSGLLARFSLPAASAGGNASAGTRNGVYDILTTAFGQAAGSSAQGSGAAGTKGLDASPEERLRDIRKQRERLTLLLGEYEAEEGRLKGVNVKNSKSETEFERIESEEVGDGKAGLGKQGSAKQGWGEWVWGGKGSRGAKRDEGPDSGVGDAKGSTTGADLRS